MDYIFHYRLKTDGLVSTKVVKMPSCIANSFLFRFEPVPRFGFGLLHCSLFWLLLSDKSSQDCSLCFKVLKSVVMHTYFH